MNDDRIRQITYVIMTIAGLVAPVLVAVQAAIEQGASPFEILVAVTSALTALGTATAAVKLNTQIKEGVLLPGNMTRKIDEASTKIDAAQTKLDQLRSTTDIISSTKLGPLASRALNEFRDQ